MPFSIALVLFLVGAVGIGLPILFELPDLWIVISIVIGLGAWIIFALWDFIDRTLGMIHHLKRSREIDKEYKAERTQELAGSVQRRRSKSKQRAVAERKKLWINTLFGTRD